MAKSKDPRTVEYKEVLAKQAEKLSSEEKSNAEKGADLAGVGVVSKK